MIRRPAVLLLATLVLSSCASTGSTSMAQVAPMLSVERFLQAANTRDLEAMAAIFGTSKGSINATRGNPVSCAFRKMGSWIGLGQRCITWQEVELRMDAIALILRHDDYQVLSESMVAGRDRPTRRVLVDIQRGANRYREVPFVVVQTSGGRWLVEEIGLERVTSYLEPVDAPAPVAPELLAGGEPQGHMGAGGV